MTTAAFTAMLSCITLLGSKPLYARVKNNIPMPFNRNPNLTEKERERNRLKARKRRQRLIKKAGLKRKREHDKTLRKALKEKRLSEKEELAYLAGLLEGEGTVSLYKHGTAIYPRVTIANTEPELVQAFYDFFENGSTTKSQLRSGTPYYIWITQHQDVIFERMTKLLPYLRGIRRQQTILMLKYIISRKADSPKAHYTEEQLKMVEQMRELHRKPKHAFSQDSPGD